MGCGFVATPGELVKVVAASTGTEEPTVTQHDRNLVIAGLRSKGGRGRSAAKVTARDAAHLLTALLGSAMVKDSAETVLRYSKTEEHRYFTHRQYNQPDEPNIYKNIGISELQILPLGHSFIDSLTAIIGLAAEGKLVKELGDFYPLGGINVILTSPSTHARITMNLAWREPKTPRSVQADYGPYQVPSEELNNDPRLLRPSLTRTTEMNAQPILYVGALLAGKLDELPKLDAPVTSDMPPSVEGRLAPYRNFNR